jgi:hypothetical protein
MLKLRILSVALSLAALFSLTACSKKKSSTAPPADPTHANQLVQQANASLGAIIAAQISGPDPERPSDIDFREPYGLYQQALGADPGNRDAMFGVAIIGLATLTTDAQVNAAFDEWSAYLSSHVPFEAGAATGPLGIPLHLGRGRDVMKLPFEEIALSAAALPRAGLTGADPQISTIQGILENRALPLLTQARAYLDVLAGDPNYTFIVTPQMQGDAGADPIEIDRTDLLALRAGAGLLTSLCDVAVAYHLSFATYDSVGLVQAFDPGSDWLTLRPNGSTRMSQARLALLEAVDDGQASITSLRGESDPQDDDLIKLGPGDMNIADAESLKVYLGHVRTALNGGFRLTRDWDGDSGTPDVTLNIQPVALFSNPVSDWKALLPDYTAGAVRRPGDVTYQGTSGYIPANVTISTAGYYSAYATTETYDRGANLYHGGYGDAPLQAQAVSASHTLYKDFASGFPGWARSYYNYVSFYGYLNPGSQTISLYFGESYDVSLGEFFVPTLTWTATNVSQWVWPDPSFNGLFPQLVTNNQMLTLFGYDPASWERTIVLDWTSSGDVYIP